jgi:WD40 repeat protein
MEINGNLMSYNPILDRIVLADFDSIKILDTKNAAVLQSINTKIFSSNFFKAYSNDGRYIATIENLPNNSIEKYFNILNAENGELQTRLVVKQKENLPYGRCAIFSSDSSKIITITNGDKILRIWNSMQGTELASLVCYEDGEWIWITPDNYYYASPNGEKYISATKDGVPVSLVSYKKIYNRPDIVSGRLSGKLAPGL